MPREVIEYVIRQVDDGSITLGGSDNRKQAQEECALFNQEWRDSTPWIVYWLTWPWHHGTKYVVGEERYFVPTLEESQAYGD